MKRSIAFVLLSVSAALAQPAVPPPPPPAANPLDISIPEFGISLKLPEKWMRITDAPPGLLARFAPEKSEAGKRRVMDLLVSTFPEGTAPNQARDRSLEYYKKSVKDAEIAEPVEVNVAGMPGFEIRMTYPDRQGQPVTFIERLFVVAGNRVYALRMAGDGKQIPELAALLASVSDTVKLDKRITEPPDPASLSALVEKAKTQRLTQLIPTEQYMLFEHQGKTVGYVFLRFERARFMDTEGWYLRVRSLQISPDGGRVQVKAWTFSSADWAKESWAATSTRTGKDPQTGAAVNETLEESGKRALTKAELKYRLPGQPEKTENFDVGTDYVPAAVEPAFTVLAAREAKRDIVFSMHEPGRTTVQWTLTPGKPETVDGQTVHSVLRRSPIQTGGQTQKVDASGKTTVIDEPGQPMLKAVDKAALLAAYPDALKLD